jgi:hypothetical protein
MSRRIPISSSSISAAILSIIAWSSAEDMRRRLHEPISNPALKLKKAHCRIPRDPESRPGRHCGSPPVPPPPWASAIS